MNEKKNHMLFRGLFQNLNEMMLNAAHGLGQNHNKKISFKELYEKQWISTPRHKGLE